MLEASEKAAALIEALPYIQRFKGRQVVVKFGGSAMEDERVMDDVIEDVVFLATVGIRPILVHGGGKAISRAMEQSGIEPRFVAGLRVTDERTLDVVVRVLGGEVNERQLKSLVRVRQNSDHLLGLVNDLLDLSKIEAGRMVGEMQAFGVRALISACCETVAPLLKEGTRLRQDVSSEVGEALSDETKIRQIVINLLSNALKHTDEGEVWVRVSRDGSGDLEIAVSGTGTGIPVDQLEAIFQEFTQVKGSDPQHKGTGLGLPITKGYAELLGGSIVVESKVGEGSTFTVRIPMEFTEG